MIPDDTSLGRRRSAAGFAIAVALAVVTLGIASAVFDLRIGAPDQVAASLRASAPPCMLLVEASCTPIPGGAGDE